MSKKSSVAFKDQKLDIFEFNGSILVQRTMVGTDFRGAVINHPTETLFALSAEEVSQFSRALADAVSNDETPNTDGARDIASPAPEEKAPDA